MSVLVETLEDLVYEVNAEIELGNIDAESDLAALVVNAQALVQAHRGTL